MIHLAAIMLRQRTTTQGRISQRHHRLDRPRFDRLAGQHPDQPLTLVSQTAENAEIFSDGIEADYIEFNSGTRATISIADKHGTLVA
jgi:hypothetical protein